MRDVKKLPENFPNELFITTLMILGSFILEYLACFISWSGPTRYMGIAEGLAGRQMPDQ